MIGDPELLQRYAGNGDQAAFRELVRRHVDFVYGVAARHACNPSRAEDVVQQVFVKLARHADRLERRKEIIGWLYICARYTALKVVREEVRRQAREKEAQMIQHSPEPVDWHRLQPIIDEALQRLSDGDRSALLLRYFKNLPYAESAQILGINDDAARRRVERALERLRLILARQGAASSAEALALALEAQPPSAAPAALVGAAADAALVALATARRSTPGLIKVIRMLFDSGALSGGLGLAALFVAAQAWQERAITRSQEVALTAAQRANALDTERLAAANQAAAKARQAYDDLKKRLIEAQQRAADQTKGNRPVPSTSDPALRRLAFQELNTWHAETDMPFFRQMHWSPQKIQAFLDDEAVDSNIPGIYAEGVEVTIRDDDGKIQTHRIKDDLRAESSKWMDFLRQNQAYAVAGLLAKNAYGQEPLSTDQAAALTHAFKDNTVVGDESADNWNRIIAAGAQLLSPNQMAVLRNMATESTGIDFELDAP